MMLKAAICHMTGRIQKCMIHLNPVKSLVQHHQTRMTLRGSGALSVCVRGLARAYAS